MEWSGPYGEVTYYERESASTHMITCVLIIAGIVHHGLLCAY